jgi:hypothetical protein
MQWHLQRIVALCGGAEAFERSSGEDSRDEEDYWFAPRDYWSPDDDDSMSELSLNPDSITENSK